MAGQLKFEVDDVLLSIIAHTEANPEAAPYYGEKIEPSLFLVKDHGVYLMSASKVAQMAEGEGESRVVAFAEGHDPAKAEFDDWWYLGQDVCGGDDFAEPLELAFFSDAAKAGAKEIVFTVTESAIEMKALVS